MTARQLYEGVLIELNKENAPNILLEDFNYFANKAINNYVNKRYNIYDINQQTTDDLRVLKSNSMLTPTHVSSYTGMTMAGDEHMATYEVTLPSDYLHILNCICIYKVNKTYSCYNKNDHWRAPATRLTADQYSQVLDNFWNKPTYKKPYYYIHNVNTSNAVPTNPVSGSVVSNVWSIDKLTKTTTYSDGRTVAVTYNHPNDYTGDDEIKVVSTLITEGNGGKKGTDSATNVTGYGTDGNGIDIVQGSGLPKSISIGGSEVSNVERGAAIRYGNVSQVRMEIRYGTDNTVFELEKVYIDYIKAPQNIRLTQLEIDKTEDVSQMLEYPDYVCQEIINELVHLIMENISDQRLQTHPVVSQSIANPAQQQAPEAAGQTA